MEGVKRWMKEGYGRGWKSRQKGWMEGMEEGWKGREGMEGGWKGLVEGGRIVRCW